MGSAISTHAFGPTEIDAVTSLVSALKAKGYSIKAFEYSRDEEKKQTTNFVEIDKYGIYKFTFVTMPDVVQANITWNAYNQTTVKDEAIKIIEEPVVSTETETVPVPETTDIIPQ